ncbi:YbaB/EbfC family nucleoid-associated protein [Amycolatopsis anabasis]|uniref:YbaB/EbfC family nucleoid-associated protein n=1 Tax=Amycolatopsis anabasis TaxID=1840409 RepID=UPI00131CAFA9|nr:YbaB/EbfC family nucleoid-associated protein [Amycolatopsis anabasis]
MDLLDELAAARRQAAERTSRVHAVIAERAGIRMRGEAAGVTATVDGNAALLGIEFTRESMRRQSQVLGTRIVEAVAVARRAAALDSRAAMAEVLGSQEAADALMGKDDTLEPAVRPAPARTDDYFERLDSDGFLR